MALVALRGRRSSHVQAVQEAPDAGDADSDVAVTGQLHDDLVGSEVVVLSWMDDLAMALAFGMVCGRLERSRKPSRLQFRSDVASRSRSDD